jgi:hypothetical protein
MMEKGSAYVQLGTRKSYKGIALGRGCVNPTGCVVLIEEDVHPTNGVREAKCSRPYDGEGECDSRP